MVYYNACNPRNEVDTEGSETNIILDYITNFRLARTTWLKKNKMYLRLVVLQRHRSFVKFKPSLSLNRPLSLLLFTKAYRVLHKTQWCHTTSSVFVLCEFHRLHMSVLF